MANLRQKTAAPTRKVLAYTASGATAGPAIATLVIWAFETIAQQPMPTPVQGAILTLCILVSGFIGAYQTSAGESDIPIVDPEPDGAPGS